MNLKPMSLNQNNSISKNIPQWINLNADESTSIYFLIFPDKLEAAFNAVNFLNIIAPFVSTGSYIVIDDTYKWYFDGSTCKRIDFDS